MKIKMRNQIKILNYITSKEKFKALFVMITILSLYGSIILGVSEDNFIDSILIPFQFPIFNLFFSSIIFLNTLNTCSCFNKEFSYYIIRLNNKRKYLKEMAITSILMNVFIIFLFFIMYFIVLNVFKLGHIQIQSFQNYNINNLFYSLFYLLRYVTIILIINMIITMIFITTKLKVSFVFMLTFLAGFLINPLSATIRESFTFNIWNYFMNIRYASFINELSYSFLFIFLLQLIFYILYNILSKNNRWSIL